MKVNGTITISKSMIRSSCFIASSSSYERQSFGYGICLLEVTIILNGPPDSTGRLPPWFTNPSALHLLHPISRSLEATIHIDFSDCQFYTNITGKLRD